MTESNRFTIHFDRTERTMLYRVAETATDLTVLTEDDLVAAFRWAQRPTCTQISEFFGIGGVDDLTGDSIIVERCDREAEHRIIVFDAELATLETDPAAERAGQMLYLLCDGHAAEMRSDIAAGEWPDSAILEDARLAPSHS